MPVSDAREKKEKKEENTGRINIQKEYSRGMWERRKTCGSLNSGLHIIDYIGLR